MKIKKMEDFTHDVEVTKEVLAKLEKEEKKAK